MLGLLTRWALALIIATEQLRHANVTMCGQHIGLCVVLFSVLQKAVDEDLRLNHIFEKRAAKLVDISHCACV